MPYVSDLRPVGTVWGFTIVAQSVAKGLYVLSLHSFFWWL